MTMLPVSDIDRAAFALMADALIPAAEGMPAATDVGVNGPVLDRLLGLRPDLLDAFVRGCESVLGMEPQTAVESLNANDIQAFSAISLVAAAGYYMSPAVRELIGYPGQENRPADAYEIPAYMENGTLQAVEDRGPIYRKA